MNLTIRSFMVCLLCLAYPVLVFSASELTFNASAQPSKLVLGGESLLGYDSSTGFNLRYSKGDDVTNTRLSKISTSGNEIKVSHPDGKPEFTFQIDTYDNHLAIHLLDAQGIGTGRDYSLSLELDAEGVAVYTLNDLMTANTGNQRGRRTRGNNTVLSWPYLWGRPRPNGTRGSVVLYNNRLSGSARDEVLAEIWSAQGTAGHMVRPAGQATWAPADVLSWVDRWVAKFSKIATVSIDAANKEELYEMTDKYLIPSGANRLYMFSTVWRGEYHLDQQTMVDVNTKIFPNGKSDLIAYSEYLAKHGAHLQLKSLGPQIGKNDERYISSSSVDRRLMSWCTGTLAEDVDPSATTIRFRPGPEPMVRMETEGPMRLGNEIISAGRITRTDDVWVLENCERGYGASTAKSHRAGTEMQGIVLSNGVIDFEDDFGMPNSIAEEICGEYGDFLNELNVGHLHFDGSGRMGIYPWYVRDFTDYVYSRQDQPVTGSTVGGGIKANFEKQFSAAKAISGATGYRDIRIGPRLYQRGRKHTEFATSMLDLNFDVSDGINLGSRRPTFCGGQSGGSLSLNTLNSYGLTGYAFQLFKYWIELAPVFDDADADYVAGFLRKTGNHYGGEDVLVLSKNGEGDYIFTPHRVMGRTSGEDAPFTIDQEWGAVPRFQNITAGTTMELLNPYDAQEPQVVIYVVETSSALKNPIIKVNGRGELSVKGEIQPNEYMKFESGNTVNVYDYNWNLLRSLPAMTKSFTVNKGNNTVTTTAGSGSDTPDLRVQFITLGPTYVLESNKHLQRQVRSSQ